MVLSHAAALVCALSAVIFAAAGVSRFRLVVAIAAGAAFVIGALWLRPGPAAVGGLVALWAGVLLRWPRFWEWSAAVGGLTAGFWSAIVVRQGLPVAPAWILAASFPVAAALWSSRQPSFAPAVLREEALLAVAGLGLVVAAGPSLVQGWTSASALNLEPAGGVRQTVGVWVIVVTAMSVSLGGWHSLRRRR